MAKRGATSDLNQDNWDQEDEQEEGGHYSLANQDELQNRVFRRAKRTLPKTDGGEGRKSAFSGFGGFGKNTKVVSFNERDSSTLGNIAGNGCTEPTKIKLSAAFGEPSKRARTMDSSEEGGPSQSQDSKYYQHLKKLNETFVQWITEHMSKNPFCNFIPVCQDYVEHVDKIEKMFPVEQETSSTAFTLQKTDSTKISPLTASSGSLNKKPSGSLADSSADSIAKSGFSNFLKSNRGLDSKKSDSDDSEMSYGAGFKSNTTNTSTFSFGNKVAQTATSSISPSGPTFSQGSMNKSADEDEKETDDPESSAKPSIPTFKFRFKPNSTSSPSGTDNKSSPFGTDNKSSPFGADNKSSAFGTDNKSSGFGTDNKSSGFGTDNKSSGFGTDNKSSPFGTDNKSSPFGKNNKTSPFGTDNKSSPFGTDNKSSPFGTSTKSSPFRADNKSSPFGADNKSSPFGTDNKSSAFGTDNKSSLFRNDNKPSPFGNDKKISLLGNDNKSSPFSFSVKPVDPKNFSFAAPTTNSSLSALFPSSATETEENEEEYVPPKNEGTAVVEDDAFYTKRCKVYFKKDDSYMDKGIGLLYLKPLNGKTQLLIRNDTNIGTVLLNIVLSSAIPIAKSGKNNVLLTCVPNPPIDADNPESMDTIPILIRVKTSEDADELLSKLNECKS